MKHIAMIVGSWLLVIIVFGGIGVLLAWRG